MVRGVVQTVREYEHAEIIQRGIDKSMDVYKLGFVLSQIVALFFLTYSVLRRNKYLQNRHIARVKLRLIQLNLILTCHRHFGPSSLVRRAAW